MDKSAVNNLSPGALAFVGDAYFGLLVRTRLAEVNRPAGDLHSLSLKLVKASEQAKGFEAIESMLTEKEMAVFKRGRNAHVNSVPKSASVRDYHIATGLETLFGYLNLANEQERAEELFDYLWEKVFVL